FVKRRKTLAETRFGRQEVPVGRFEQRPGVGAVGLDADPALDAPCIREPAQFDRIARQGRWLEWCGGCRGGAQRWLRRMVCAVQAAALAAACLIRRATVSEGWAPTPVQ